MKIRIKIHQYTGPLLITLGLFGFIACDADKSSENQITAKAVVNNYADLVYSNYADAHKTALNLKSALEDLVNEPTNANLDAAKTAWLAARVPYGQSEAFRFYGGPIDDEDGPEGQLNAWPLDESYIDYTSGNVNGSDPNNGTNIINSPALFPTIDKNLLISVNENGGETNISTGYHAIEFLLWGQDLSTGPGGGERPVSDFIVTGDDTTPEARRGQYLIVAIDLILEDLQSLIDEWKVGGNYRGTFTAENEVQKSLEKILAGIGKLSKGELAGERMFVAWDEKSKEDEHSCFSDNTHNDIYLNALGINNVIFGKYTASEGTKITGPSIADLVQQNDTGLYNELLTITDAALSSTTKIEAPFDQEILDEPGRTRVKVSIDNLRKQGDKISEISAMFGYILDPNDI